MRLRAGAVVALSCVALTLSACGGDSRQDNASQFKDEVAGLDLGTEIKVADGSGDGVVEGSFAGPGEKPSRFWFSFGPDPVDDFDRYDKGTPTFVQRWMGGDDFFEAAEETPAGLSRKQRDRYYEIQFAIEDAACRAATGEDCKGP